MFKLKVKFDFVIIIDFNFFLKNNSYTFSYNSILIDFDFFQLQLNKRIILYNLFRRKLEISMRKKCIYFLKYAHRPNRPFANVNASSA